MLGAGHWLRKRSPVNPLGQWSTVRNNAEEQALAKAKPEGVESEAARREKSEVDAEVKRSF